MSEIFGYRLNKLRSKRNYLLRDIAKALGVTPTTISKWERDKLEPSIERLPQIAALFGVSVDYLTGRDAETVYAFHKARNSICSYEDFKKIHKFENADEYAYEEWEKEQERDLEQLIELHELKSSNPVEYVERAADIAKREAAKSVGLYDMFFSDELPEKPDYDTESELYLYNEYLEYVELDQETLESIYNIEPN